MTGIIKTDKLQSSAGNDALTIASNGSITTAGITSSVTSGTTATLSSSQATSNIDILKLDATGTSSSSNLKFNVASGAQGQIRLSGNNDISIHNTSSDTERLRILGTGGLTFNGDTAAANALDDYEEGTWTAAVATGVTLSQSAGTYTKIGRQVTVSGAFNVGSVSSPSGGSITGLPFTSGSGTGFSTAGSIWLNTINTQEGKTLQIRMDQNTNNVVFTDLAGGNAGGASSYLKANSVINLSLTYFTA